MRNERKYLALSVLSFLVIALFLVTCAREPWRMTAAAERQDHEWAALGAKLYAQNCMQCHGAKGQGVVGMPLNRKEFQGNPNDSKYKDTYLFLYNTIANGRPGSIIPTWVKQPDGRWLSYTKMPAWFKDAGGPFDENMVRAVTYFIMLGNKPSDLTDETSPSFWDSVGSDKFPPQPVKDPEGKTQLPKAQGLTDAENQEAWNIITKKAVPTCLACHSIGTRGGAVGPDLTYVGSWGVDADFLKAWISDPTKMPQDRRLPVFWSKHRLETGPTPVLKDPVLPQVTTQMPPFKDRLSPQELDLLVRYLLGLKAK